MATDAPTRQLISYEGYVARVQSNYVRVVGNDGGALVVDFRNLSQLIDLLIDVTRTTQYEDWGVREGIGID